MIRGEIWIVSGGAVYTGKPRPALIVQNSDTMDVDSVVICPFTTEGPASERVRPAFEPTAENGLRAPCRLMVDKISAVPKSKLDKRIGAASLAEIGQVDDALLLFLGLAG